ncbi:hypothetical protein M8C21_022926, partial [Ambrosia artemisiifolia]
MIGGAGELWRRHLKVGFSLDGRTLVAKNSLISEYQNALQNKVVVQTSNHLFIKVELSSGGSAIGLLGVLEKSS